MSLDGDIMFNMMVKNGTFISNYFRMVHKCGDETDEHIHNGRTYTHTHTHTPTIAIGENAIRWISLKIRISTWRKVVRLEFWHPLPWRHGNWYRSSAPYRWYWSCLWAALSTRSVNSFPARNTLSTSWKLRRCINYVRCTAWHPLISRQWV